jgi:hypothetical protein
MNHLIIPVGVTFTILEVIFGVETAYAMQKIPAGFNAENS